MATTHQNVEIKSKGQLLGAFEYVEPDSLAEGVQMDGEEKVFSLYKQKRKTNWMDAKRKELTGGGLPKKIIDALRNMPKDKLDRLLGDLDLDIEV